MDPRYSKSSSASPKKKGKKEEEPPGTARVEYPRARERFSGKDVQRRGARGREKAGGNSKAKLASLVRERDDDVGGGDYHYHSVRSATNSQEALSHSGASNPPIWPRPSLLLVPPSLSLFSSPSGCWWRDTAVDGRALARLPTRARPRSRVRARRGELGQRERGRRCH